jgi:hypothetical protein
MHLYYLGFISRSLHVSGTCCTHHQEYNTAVGSHWYNIYALDREMYGSVHFKGCPDWMVVTSLWLSWSQVPT